MSNGEGAETSAKGGGPGGPGRAAGRGESLTGWLKGLGSEGRMCRWAIMACSLSLSLASCGEAGGGQELSPQGSGPLPPPHPTSPPPDTQKNPSSHHPSPASPASGSLCPLLLSGLGSALRPSTLKARAWGCRLCEALLTSPPDRASQARAQRAAELQARGPLANNTCFFSPSKAEAVAEQHPSSVALVCERVLAQ